MIVEILVEELIPTGNREVSYQALDLDDGEQSFTLRLPATADARLTANYRISVRRGMIRSGYGRS